MSFSWLKWTGESADAVSLLGSVYTCISIIVVFHMAALQSWLTTANELEKLAFDTDATTLSDDLSRSLVAKRVENHKKRFPVIQVVWFSVSLAVLCVLTVALAVQIDKVAVVYTITPAAAFVVTFLGATAGTLRRGSLTLSGASARLAHKS